MRNRSAIDERIKQEKDHAICVITKTLKFVMHKSLFLEVSMEAHKVLESMIADSIVEGISEVNFYCKYILWKKVITWSNSVLEKGVLE